MDPAGLIWSMTYLEGFEWVVSGGEQTGRTLR